VYTTRHVLCVVFVRRREAELDSRRVLISGRMEVETLGTAKRTKPPAARRTSKPTPSAYWASSAVASVEHQRTNYITVYKPPIILPTIRHNDHIVQTELSLY